MGLFNKNKKVLKQNLEEKAEFQNLFQVHLLFEDRPEKPSVEDIRNALCKEFGDVDTVSDNKELTSFAVIKYHVPFTEGNVPAQLLIGDAVPFENDKITPIEGSQQWGVENSEEFFGRCNYYIMISDFMSSTLDYKKRCELLIGWIETALSIFPSCIGVWIPSAGKLLTREHILNSSFEGESKYIYTFVNVRFFNIEGSDDKLIDTLGLYAFGLPDIQYHFHSLDPNIVVNHAYNVASYIFNANAPIKSGETIDGINGSSNMCKDIQWKCQYEVSLIQPVRDVMDVCPGEHASGDRE